MDKWSRTQRHTCAHKFMQLLNILQNQVVVQGVFHCGMVMYFVLSDLFLCIVDVNIMFGFSLLPAFDLPGGVRLLCAFMTPEELSSLGPRKRANTHCRNTEGQRMESNPFSSSNTEVSESSPLPQQVQGAKSAYSLSAVLESAEIQEGVDGVGDDSQDKDQSEPVLRSLVTQPFLTAVVNEHRSDVDDGMNVEESRSKLMCVSAAPCSNPCATDNNLQHDLSEGVARRSDLNEKVEADPENVHTGRQIESVSGQAALGEKKESIFGLEETEGLDRKVPESSPKDVKILVEASSDGSAMDSKDRHSGDGSSAEDGGAETQRVTHDFSSKHSACDFSSFVENSPDFTQSKRSQENCPQGCEPAEDAVCDAENNIETPWLGSLNTPVLENTSTHDPVNRVTANSSSDSVKPPVGCPPVTSSSEDCSQQENAIGGEGGGVADDSRHGEQSDLGTGFSGHAGEEKDVDGGEAVSRNSFFQSGGSAVVSSPSPDNDGNSHYIATVTGSELAANGEDIGLSPDNLTTQRNLTADSPGDYLASSASKATQADTLPSENALATLPSQDSLPGPQTLPSPLAPTDHFDAVPRAMEQQTLPSPLAPTDPFDAVPRAMEQQESSGSPSVPVDVELQLDLMRSGASSALTVSDDLMSPNKERLSFETALLNSGSSSSGCGSSLAQNVVASQPQRSRK